MKNKPKPSAGARVVVAFNIPNLLDHDEKNWESVVRWLLIEEGLFSVVDEAGEVLSVEKWNGTER